MHLIDERTRGFGGASFVFERGVGGVVASERRLDLSILYDLACGPKKASSRLISQIAIGRAVKGGAISPIHDC